MLPALLLGACGDDTGSGDDAGGEGLSAVTVSGDFGAEPEVTWDGDLRPERARVGGRSSRATAPRSRTVRRCSRGSGSATASRESKAYSTFGKDAKPDLLTVGRRHDPSAHRGDRRQDDRQPGRGRGAARRTPSASRATPSSASATRTRCSSSSTSSACCPTARPAPTRSPASWAPAVEGGDTPTALDFKGTPEPNDKLRVTTLIEGEGPATEKGQTLYVNYLGQVYDGKAPFDASYERGEPLDFELGAGGVVKGWDQGLKGVPVGSRVILAVPPELGYGEEGNKDAGIKGTDTLVLRRRRPRRALTHLERHAARDRAPTQDRMQTSRKTERLFNLLIMLLVQKRYVTKDRIREILYPDAGDDAFEKMFERDKEELRSLGVPIEVGRHRRRTSTTSPATGSAPTSSRCPRSRSTADEAAVVGLATKVWSHAKLAAATTEAVSKLTAYGVPVDVDALDIGEPRIGADEPAFDVFWAAALERTAVVVRLPPGRPRADDPAPAAVGGRALLGAAGTPSGATPTATTSGSSGSRGSSGAARLDGRPGSYTIPPGTDIRAIAERLAPPPPTETAVVLVRPGAGAVAAPAGTGVEAGVDGPDGEVWDRLSCRRAPGLLDELIALGADLVVEAPATVRDEVVAPAARRGRGGAS